MNIIEVRGLVSMSLLLVFILVVLSGTLLFLDMLEDGNYVLLLDKHGWKDVHVYAGYLMLVLVIVHLYLNWRVFVTELNRLGKT